MKNKQTSISRIRIVARALEDLAEKTAFVGGATVSLYASDSAAFESRPTDDVDVVVEIVSYSEFIQFEKKMRAVGFENDLESKVICRYKIRGIIVDMMPIDSAALGFSNSWYELGMKNTLEVEIAANLKVLIFQTPYFLASKFEALMDRGMSDIRYSSDFEDIIYLFDNRAELLEELKNADFAVKSYLQKMIYLLFQHPIIQEAIESTVEQDFIFARATKIIQIWKEFLQA
jgi:predicted nucleotidyltransferase